MDVRNDIRACEFRMLALGSQLNLESANSPFQTERAKRARVGNILAMVCTASRLSAECLRYRSFVQNVPDYISTT